MGYVNEAAVTTYGQQVIEALKASEGEPVRYMDIAYDAEADNWRELGVNNTAGESAWFYYLAIEQLEDRGLCAVEMLDEQMPGGQQHFQFKATSKGMEFLRSGKTFTFQSVDL